MTLSTGEKIDNPKAFDKHYQKLRKAQKSLSRKQKASRNRDKARLEVARIQVKISDSRKDHLHKLTTRLVRENQTIAVEDLAVKNMVSQRVGRVSRLEATGEPVRVKNPKLARAISDASWGEFVRQLEYKQAWYGRTGVKIDRWFPSSKRCGNCGQVVERLPLNIRQWNCPNCGTHHDRDINAAKNILAVGHTVTVCGASIRPSRGISPKGNCEKPVMGRNRNHYRESWESPSRMRAVRMSSRPQFGQL